MLPGSQNLTTLNIFLLNTTQQCTNVVTSTALIQELAEHLNTRTGGFGGFFDANDFNLFADFDDAALNTTGYYGTTAEMENTSSTGIKKALSTSRSGVGM